MIETAIIEYLRESEFLRSLVERRIRKSVADPRDRAPFIVVNVSYPQRPTHSHGTSTIVDAEIQIDVYADTASNRADISKAILSLFRDTGVKRIGRGEARIHGARIAGPDMSSEITDESANSPLLRARFGITVGVDEQTTILA